MVNKVVKLKFALLASLSSLDPKNISLSGREKMKEKREEDIFIVDLSPSPKTSPQRERESMQQKFLLFFFSSKIRLCFILK